MNNKQLKQVLDQAIELREAGNLSESKLLFDQLNQKVSIKQLKHKDRKEAELTVEIITESIIQRRLEGQHKYQATLAVAKQLLELDKKQKLNNPYTYLAISSTLMDSNMFEQALPHLEQYRNASEGNSTRQGDALSHQALCLLRTGKPNEGLSLIEKAHKLINQNTADIPHLPVYQSRALITESLIQYALGQRKKAKDSANQALQVANSGKYRFRQRQAKDLVELLSA